MKDLYDLGRQIGRSRSGIARLCTQKRLPGMPNVIEVIGAYEDMRSVYLVTDQLCSGCNLFDAITRKGRYYEKDAARIGRQIVNAVHACHMNGATDFSLSVFIEEGKVYRDIVENAFYVTPEVLKRNYGKEVDVWSAGVIIYILL
ncbi:hypothetical protein MIMGU_mgv11b016131mg [Erythranthe guttata]|uniref:Protein kinase domain-containing protein n=1 Tax=Erythranthe guttata TaxID=4155 RepID=A0A022RF09_ERYGU|nr:hypothetical protein MIMGU_mgv11b016131mg [Erythranthe guttata]